MQTLADYFWIKSQLFRSAFGHCKPAVVVNLAAQAGVRYSITNPDAYVESNLVGFFNILEVCHYGCLLFFALKQKARMTCVGNQIQVKCELSSPAYHIYRGYYDLRYMDSKMVVSIMQHM